MTTYFGVSAPLGSGKTTAAIEFAGHAAKAGEKIVIAQPSIRLINQSVHQFRHRWPDVCLKAIHGDHCSNVSREIAQHTNSSSSGEVLFVTHTGLMEVPYWSRRADWHLIIDEAPSVLYYTDLTLPVNHHLLLPALEAVPYNIRYSRLVPGDVSLLEAMAENRKDDNIYRLFQELARKLSSNKWDMFVLTEQWERFRTAQITDGRLLVFGLADPLIFEGFASVTMMSANLDQTIAYKHLVQHGHTFAPHKIITNRLRYKTHENGRLLTIHYAVEDGNWSKRRRDQLVRVDGETYSVSDIIISGALNLFDGQQFAWLANKDLEEDDPFNGCKEAVQLPHSPHGLNSFQHLHNAAVLPALNPSPALYAFLDEVAHLNSDEVRRAVYHEAVYQAAGRISLRNRTDLTPKHLVVADRAAAEALAELYPGADVVLLAGCDLIPQTGKPGRRRIHATDAARKKDCRDRHRADLLRQLDQVNGKSSETKTPIIGDCVSHQGMLGGSLFAAIGRKHPAAYLNGVGIQDFIEFLRDLHTRTVAKENAWLWSPAEFESKPGVETGRGLDNITAIHGVFLDNDGGDLTPEEFASMLPDLIMVIHNSSSSTSDRKKWRAIIPTTCSMTIAVHREIMLQIRQALNRRGYYDTKQLAKRVEKGLDGKCHGFDPSKYNAASMFYLPAQASAGSEASFFLVYNGDKRRPINPYQWIDKTIINHQPEPSPESSATTSQAISVVRKDPKLTRALEAIEAERHERRYSNYQERVNAAIQRWHQHPKHTGNDEFFVLAVALAAAGMERTEAEQTLYAEAMYAHGAESQRERRRAIPVMMKKLRWSA